MDQTGIIIVVGLILAAFVAIFLFARRPGTSKIKVPGVEAEFTAERSGSTIRGNEVEGSDTQMKATNQSEIVDNKSKGDRNTFEAS